ncbi:hypothetical protein GOM49_08560 [Clostridium bovifaecis]|uniref:Prepilin-type N-terminal cleavage/methylation domain-containing protein n=1 Tax=Clostridium bovifaecis TaxID=2184719 RepID=A0A6I6EW04_9CLOT|nr:hypothetical protein GOM49_08560 [Clostridium bovifaecis]
MHKLNKNKGYSLIEVVWSLAIFFILLSFILSMEIRNLNFKRYSLEIGKYSEFLEVLKNTLVFNNEYEDIRAIVNAKGNLDSQYSFNTKLFINSENLNLESLKNKELAEVFTLEKSNDLPYLEMDIEDKADGIMKIDLNLIFKMMNQTKKIGTSFYKGDY